MISHGLRQTGISSSSSKWITVEEKRGLAIGMKRHPGWPITPPLPLPLLLNDTRLSVVRSRGPIFVRWPRQPNFLLTGSTPLSDVAPRVYDFCAPPSFVQVDRWRNEGPHRSSNSRYTRARFSLANPDPRFSDPDRARHGPASVIMTIGVRLRFCRRIETCRCCSCSIASVRSFLSLFFFFLNFWKQSFFSKQSREA